MKKGDVLLIIEKTDTGFSAYSKDFPIYTTGLSMTELFDNALEATNLFFEEDNKPVSLDQLKFEIDFKQFFHYYKIINSNFLAEKIGMNPTLLSQYINGHKKPSEKQTKRILTGINQIGRELAEINLIYK